MYIVLIYVGEQQYCYGPFRSYKKAEAYLEDFTENAEVEGEIHQLHRKPLFG